MILLLLLVSSANPFVVYDSPSAPSTPQKVFTHYATVMMRKECIHGNATQNVITYPLLNFTRTSFIWISYALKQPYAEMYCATFRKCAVQPAYYLLSKKKLEWISLYFHFLACMGSDVTDHFFYYSAYRVNLTRIHSLNSEFSLYWN